MPRAPPIGGAAGGWRPYCCCCGGGGALPPDIGGWDEFCGLYPWFGGAGGPRTGGIPPEGGPGGMGGPRIC